MLILFAKILYTHCLMYIYTDWKRSGFLIWKKKRNFYTFNIFYIHNSMKNLIFFLFTFLLLSFNFTTANFSDTEGNRYQGAIQELADRGIVQGYPWNLFKPEQAITRAELLKIILFSANIELESWEETCFNDVPQGERYYDIVCTAKAMGIVQGYPDGSFKPNQKVSFAEGLKMGIEGFWIQTKEKKSDFRYEKYLDFVHQNSIFSQYERYPEGEMTRAMMAHLANSLLKGQSKSWEYQRQSSKSAGCGKSQPSSLPNAVMVNGIERHFITSLGKNYSSLTPAKLFVAFHGRTSPNNGLGYYGIENASDGNSIFLYPAGLPEEGPQRNRRDPWDKVSALRDYELFDAMVKEVSDQYCIDLDEVYVVGHSLGWWFTSMIGCARGAQVHGVGIVGGSPMLFPTCSGPISAIIFHNPSDPLASFAGWEQIRDKILKQNQCWTETESYPSSSDMECTRYTQCLPWAGVVFCKYFSGGHMRPSGAEKMMMDFWKEE